MRALRVTVSHLVPGNSLALMSQGGAGEIMRQQILDQLPSTLTV